MKNKLATITLVTLCASGLANAERVYFGISSGSSGLSIGASLIPPAGSGWKLTRDGLSVDITKAGASAVENSQVEAYLIKLDQPYTPGEDRMAMLKKNIQASYAKADSPKIIQLDMANDARLPQCIRVHQLLSRTPADASQQTWYSDQYMLTCVLTAVAGAGVEVRYAQRYFAKKPDPAFAAKAKSLLDSVILTDKK